MLIHYTTRVLSLLSSKTLNLKNFRNLSMADQACSGTKLVHILKVLEDFAPLTLAESWDNVGLLIDPMENTTITDVMLTNDLTEEVVDEAVQKKSGLIVTYHPNIFKPLKRLTSNSWKERIAIKCIKNNIAVFSPHTSWDACQGGVNDWLAECFPGDVQPLQPNLENPKIGVGRICKGNSCTVEDFLKRVKSVLQLTHVRLALAKNKTQKDTIKSVAICAGSGSSVLNGVRADLYLTGEMLHHDVLNAAQKGIHVVLTNHSDSERGFLRVIAPKMEEWLDKKVRVHVSQCDRDPLYTVALK